MQLYTDLMPQCFLCMLHRFYSMPIVIIIIPKLPPEVQQCSHFARKTRTLMGADNARQCRNHHPYELMEGA